MKKLLLILLSIIFIAPWAQAQYQNGLMPSNRNASDATSAYNTWKSNFLTTCSNGRYRVRFDDPNHTVSEGVAYGMLLSVYNGDRPVFDGLWNYYKSFRNGNGVMHWRINGCASVVGANGATDAEVDAAMSLIVAHDRWGSGGSVNYATDARALIAAIKRHEVEAGSHVLKPGDMFGGSNITNPSYYAPGYFRAFGAFTNDQTFWNNVASRCYTVINNNLSRNNAAGGLVSDWCRADGTHSSDAGGYYSGGTRYHYDAARTPWRIATDFAWYGTADARAYCKRSSDFVRVNLGGSRNVRDGYHQNGQAYGQWHNSTFTGGFACAAIAGENQNHLNDSYGDLRGINDNNSYYNHTLKALYLLFLNGNFYLPGGGSTPNPDPDPQPPVVRGPYGGTPWPIPGRIQTENYDLGGANVAYLDNTSGNAGGAYRNDDVDIEATTDAGGGHNVGWIENGEWLEYTVNVTTAGRYNFNFRVASINSNRTFRVSMNGNVIANSVTVPNTGGWQTWQTVSVENVQLTAGQQVMRISMTSSGFNMNYVDVAPVTSQPTPNVPPTVSITSPSNNANFTAGANITITANAADSDGQVTRVEFFAGSTKVGERTTSPWSITWNNVAAGSYSLTARATDNAGASTTSSAVSITVNAPSVNNPPSVSITSPTNNASFTAGSNVSISANATDSDGQVTRVEFFAGSTKIGERTSSPWTISWNNVSAGSYVLTARATDNSGASTTSSPVSITVTQPTQPDPDPVTPGCISNSVPTASQWAVRNDWTDQNNGSSVSNESSALKITHRQWGRDHLWVIENGRSFTVEAGKQYTVSFDFRNDPAFAATSLEFGLANGVEWNGPRLVQNAIPVPGSMNAGSYVRREVTFTATANGSVNIALKINWQGQPSAQTNNFIRNISVCGTSAYARQAAIGFDNSGSYQGVSVYPNPFAGMLTLELDEASEISISDMSGIRVYGPEAASGFRNLSLDHLNSGVYILQVKQGEEIKNVKIIKN
ncbi:MAG: glycosyl hydrolase family 8 [Cytophagaceae bacterium]